MLFGALINGYKTSGKGQIHRGPHGEPDDFTGMEGDGPSRGTEVDWRVALVSTDAVAVDVVGARVMGYDAKKILYLSAMTEAGMGPGKLEKIYYSIIGF
jgi:uncharacterized protein (DUF362 family)